MVSCLKLSLSFIILTFHDVDFFKSFDAMVIVTHFFGGLCAFSVEGHIYFIEEDGDVINNYFSIFICGKLKYTVFLTGLQMWHF